MTDTIIVAVITAVTTIVAQLIINNRNNSNDRLDRIEKKLDIHNGYAERFGEIEKDIAVIKNEIKNIQK